MNCFYDFSGFQVGEIVNTVKNKKKIVDFDVWCCTARHQRTSNCATADVLWRLAAQHQTSKSIVFWLPDVIMWCMFGWDAMFSEWYCDDACYTWLCMW